jgi:hypothetical protein
MFHDYTLRPDNSQRRADSQCLYSTVGKLHSSTILGNYHHNYQLVSLVLLVLPDHGHLAKLDQRALLVLLGRDMPLEQTPIQRKQKPTAMPISSSSFFPPFTSIFRVLKIYNA